MERPVRFVFVTGSCMRARIAAAFVSIAILLTAPLAHAAPHEVRVPLHDGELRLGELSQVLCTELHLPACSLGLGTVDFKSLRRSDFVAGLNQALGEGCRVSVANDALVLHVDVDKLPRKCEAMSKALRVFTAIARPEATAAQAALYGLFMPEPFDPSRPLVVLLHGLDCNKANCTDMKALLIGDGYQVATFSYPSDQPIAESVAFFGKHMCDLRREYPQARVDILAHSMGGLVGRGYVEGDGYAGGIDRLIMVGPPNAGSGWAAWRILLEIQEHYQLWRHEPKWRASWMITDGFGEAGRDLKPGSKFLQELNARPRREGVRYTIVAGSQSPTRRVTGNCLSAAANCLTGRPAGWWGFRQCKSKLSGAAQSVREKMTGGDGPVKIESAKLAGVDDFVLVQADHATLYFASGQNPPAGWTAVRDRLAR